MPRWLRKLKTLGLDRTTGSVILVYLGGVLLALIPLGTIDDPAAYKLAQWIYGIGVIVATVFLMYWIGRRNAQLLQRSDARYRELVEQITDGIFVCDRDWPLSGSQSRCLCLARLHPRRNAATENNRRDLARGSGRAARSPGSPQHRPGRFH